MEDHARRKKSMKGEKLTKHDRQDSGGSNGCLSNVGKLRGYYDGARNKLKNYLGMEHARASVAMGSGSSSPRSTEGGGVDTDGGAMFQQRPPHCRLEGKNQVSSDDEFTDVSYSDLGHIITPKTKRLTINNNYKTSRERETKDQIQACRPSTPTPSATDEGYFDQDCDMVSSQVESGHAGPACSSTTTTTNSNSSSKASFSSTHLPGTANHHPSLATNLGDLEVEEITS